MENKQYLDYEGLEEYDELLKQYIKNERQNIEQSLEIIDFVVQKPEKLEE